MQPPRIGGGQLQAEIWRALCELQDSVGAGGPHVHPVAEVTGLQAALDEKSATHAHPYAADDHNHDASYAALGHNHDASYAAAGHDHNAAYEPKNANIQAHVAAAHAPANAQKNSDITKAEIEAVLTGQIASHSHAGGGGGSPMLVVPLVADGAALALTNMAAALGFLAASHRFAQKIDLTGFTQVRLVVNKQAVAGAAASKIILRYRTSFDATPANWSDIGASEVSVAINVQNNVLATAWINLVAGAQADVFVCPLMSGGDGALDPTIGSVTAQFK
jgi:hypothetical protein